MTRKHLALCALLLPTLAAQAQPPALSPLWNGTWVEDPARSSIFVPGTLRLTAIPHSPDLLLLEDGQRTRLSPANDNSSSPTPPLLRFRPAKEIAASTAATPATSGTTYTSSEKSHALTVSFWRVVPDGSRLVDTDIYTRTHAASTLAGTWRKTRSTEAPTTYRIVVNFPHLTVTTPNGELTVSATLSGAPAPLTGPSFAASSRNGYTVLGPHHLLETSYRHGKPAAHSHLLLSPDGHTLTERHTELGPPPHTVTIVYGRAPFDTTPPTR